MWSRHSHLHLVPESHQQLALAPTSLKPPKKPYLAALRRLAKRVGELQVIPDEQQHVRTINPKAAAGLLPGATGTALELAAKALEDTDLTGALGIRFFDLHTPTVEEFPTIGSRVEYTQMIHLNGGTESYRVRNGFVHVMINARGQVYQVHCSLRHGARPTRMPRIITPEKAIERSMAHLGLTEKESAKTELVFSSHKNKLDPCYEVTITTAEPRRVPQCLVKATTGEVVHQTNKIRATQRQPAPQPRNRRRRNPTGTTTPVNGRSFLRIPDPTKALTQQVYDVVLNSLPDPLVLKNDNVIMYMGSRKKEVRAKSDGTFNYKPGEPEFSGISSMFALQLQFELAKTWGLKPAGRPIPVYVDDPSVLDNAYFDPESYEEHMGKGTGTPNGLTKNICYDFGVLWHENGHNFVFLQAPGKDLPGSEGGGIHEAIGDVLGNLLMNWWFRLNFAQQLGLPFTVADINADRRVIGEYAAPPDGIRIQKNKKRTPRDKTGEPHDDGLIVGGAMADLLVAMANVAGADLNKVFETFGKMALAALALVPAHKVTFRDLLNAFLTADKQLNAGANDKLITKAFADHGITLPPGGGTGGIPVIIIA